MPTCPVSRWLHRSGLGDAGRWCSAASPGAGDGASPSRSFRWADAARAGIDDHQPWRVETSRRGSVGLWRLVPDQSRRGSVLRVQRSSTDGEVDRFVVRWHRAVLVAAFGFFTVLLLSLLSPGGNVATMLWVLAWAPLMLLLTIRAARAASIECGSVDIAIRGLFRTRRIALGRVRHVGVTRGTSAALLPWRVPYFELDDGSIVRADEIRSFREPSVVDDVVAAARRRINE